LAVWYTHLHVQTAQQGEEQQDLEQDILAGEGKRHSSALICLVSTEPEEETDPKFQVLDHSPPAEESLYSLLPCRAVLEAQCYLEWGCFRDKSCLDLLAIRTTHPMTPSKTSRHSFHPAEKVRRSWFPMEI